MPLTSPSPSGLIVIDGSAEPTSTDMSSESPSASSSESPTDTSSASPTASSVGDNNEGSCGGGYAGSGCAMTPQPTSGMFVAASALRKAGSFKYTMTRAGDAAGELGERTDNSHLSCGTGPYTIKGTIANQKAGTAGAYQNPVSVFDADVTCPGLHIIKVGNNVYIDQGNTGRFVKSELGDSRELDFLSPAAEFGDFVSPPIADGFTRVGSEGKDGVSTDHYRATSEALQNYPYLSSASHGDATWTGDVWITQSSGIPVSMDVVATYEDKSLASEVKFDITNINDPANRVTAPAT
jgi:hypothetical protein